MFGSREERSPMANGLALLGIAQNWPDAERTNEINKEYEQKWSAEDGIYNGGAACVGVWKKEDVVR